MLNDFMSMANAPLEFLYVRCALAGSLCQRAENSHQLQRAPHVRCGMSNAH
jgi:hypothetical protein